MKTPNIPTFASPELQKAVDAARPHLEGADQAMNRVSNDIRALEGYLQSLNLKHEYRYSLGKDFCAAEGEENHVAAMLEYSGGASGTMQEEALVWGKDKTGAYRLLHEVSTWDGSIDVDYPGGPYFWDESTLRREAKPLIETPFDVRKRMYQQHFANFVSSMGEHLRIEKGPPQAGKPALDGEIPF